MANNSNEPFDQYKYIAEFKRENYDRLEVLIGKGNKKKLKELSKKSGSTVNQLIVSAVEEKYNIDLTTKTQ